jgi:predicted transcriptional regulator
MVPARSRTDFPTAVQQILQILESGEPYTLNRLTQESGLNFRTVKKAVEFLQRNRRLLQEKTLEVSSADRLTIIRSRERAGGMALYPDRIQQLIIKTAYYPTVSREEEILTYLFIVNALDVSRAADIPEDSKLRELLEAEHVARTPGGKYYLTSDGQTIARGALRLYPELKNASG